MPGRRFVDQGYLDFEAGDGNSESSKGNKYYTQPQIRDRDHHRFARQEYRGQESDSSSDDEGSGILKTSLLELDSILCETHGKAPSQACDTCKSVMMILGPYRCRMFGVVPLETIPEASSSLETFWNQGSENPP